MIGDNDVAVTIAVRDVDKAQSFYEGVLGLKKVEIHPDGLIMYATGNSRLAVYQSEFAGTNRATAATWTVPSGIEDLARELKAKGVQFEHYDIPGATLEGDLHVGFGMKSAWFKDPDGNILNISTPVPS